MAAQVKEIVAFETTMGNFEVEMNRAKAPVTVENFVRYVKDGFFDGTIFHRVIPGFMIQGGGHLPDGTQKKTRSPIILEAKNGLRNAAGTIAMARTMDPNSASSQFFVNLVNNDFLNPAPGNAGYTVFGAVISGMDVVKKIEKVKTANRGPNQDWPVADVVIKRAYLKQ
jgi:peptidyl-prolyl cis-trans isomerase A (cyclophilin A)